MPDVTYSYTYGFRKTEEEPACDEARVVLHTCRRGGNGRPDNHAH